MFFPRILVSLPPLPRQPSAAIGCTKNYQPIGVTAHCDESFEGLLQRCRRGRCCSEMWKKTQFFLNTLYMPFVAQRLNDTISESIKAWMHRSRGCQYMRVKTWEKSRHLKKLLIWTNSVACNICSLKSEVKLDCSINCYICLLPSKYVLTSTIILRLTLKKGLSSKHNKFSDRRMEV